MDSVVIILVRESEMRLDEIKQINESSTPVHLTMTLDQVIRDGKVSNTAQWLVMAQVVQMFKYGNRPRYMYENPISEKEFMDQLKGLSPEEQVKCSKCCRMMLMAQEATDEMASYYKLDMTISEWLVFVNQKQD
jgi:hypothetical protein